MGSEGLEEQFETISLETSSSSIHMFWISVDDFASVKVCRVGSVDMKLGWMMIVLRLVGEEFAGGCSYGEVVL